MRNPSFLSVIRTIALSLFISTPLLSMDPPQPDCDDIPSLSGSCLRTIESMIFEQCSDGIDFSQPIQGALDWLRGLEQLDFSQPALISFFNRLKNEFCKHYESHVKTLINREKLTGWLTRIDKTHIAFASTRHIIEILDIASGERLTIPHIHKDWITCALKLKDNTIASAQDDGTIRILDLSSGECLKTLDCHKNTTSSIIQLDETHIASSSYDKTIKIWHLPSGECLKSLKGHTDWINYIIRLDKTRIASSSMDGTIKIWDITSGECLKTLNGRQDFLGLWEEVDSIIKLDKTRIAWTSGNETIEILDITPGKCLKILKGHQEDVNAIIKLDKARIASGSDDGTIKIWDVTTGQCLLTLEGHEKEVESIIHIDNAHIVSMDDSTIKIWTIPFHLSPLQMLLTNHIQEAVKNNQPIILHDDWKKVLPAKLLEGQ